jgi:hypothetical protein
MSSSDTIGISRSACSVPRTPCQRRDLNRIDGAAHHEIDLDLDFDAISLHQQLGLARIGRCQRMCLEALLLEACHGLADCRVDAPERLLARQSVVGEYQIEID